MFPARMGPFLRRHTPRLFSTSSLKCSTANEEEVAFFRKLSSEWWRTDGEFAYLHRMNFARAQFIYDMLIPHRDLDAHGGSRWLSGMTAVDVGCGGGVFSETLARLGADAVLGVDAVHENVLAAQDHKSQDPKLDSLSYENVLAEGLIKRGTTFDLVCSMDVLEHVDNAPLFLDSLCNLVRPGGFLVMSTIARTCLSDLVTIKLAEDVLRLVSKGTHHYDKFVNPSELVHFFENDKKWGSPIIRGTAYNPLLQKWHLFRPGEFAGFFENANYLMGIQCPVKSAF